LHHRVDEINRPPGFFAAISLFSDPGAKGLALARFRNAAH
jgi:hypothetical protein